ncbi:hypothetical protein [Streptomyces nymphaeiformis]|uniref:Uncharacterized protein n=1 Tax=Streptomyces nymphaeiformis TaxID=2663842 RepID=A0A7W7XBF3_9ACTN|nr:hypothetical protein [Streptomyces nymphaeiformis]MBB4982504.1 hypothetical protein [Streptomyces nymphaeiformis]
MTPEEINNGPAREAGTPEVPGYPVLLPEEGDPRFSERLLMDVHAVLRAHGYPELGDEQDLEHLELTLHWFLYSEQISERTRALWDLLRSASDGAGLPLGSKRRALATALLARLEAGQDIRVSIEDVKKNSGRVR